MCNYGAFMSVRKVVVLLAAALGMAGGEASAAGFLDKPYVSGRISVEIADANQFIYDKGVGGIVAAGVRLGDKWRAEYSFSRRTTNISGIPPLRAEGAHSTWSHLANVFYHPLGVDKPVSPFLGVGGGFNIAKLRAYSTETDPVYAGLGFPAQRHVTKALQGQVGVSVKVTRRIAVEAAAVYFTSDDRHFESTFPNNRTVEAAYRTYSAQVGARFNF